MKASIVVDPFFKNNRLFDLSDKVANRDNCLYPFYMLRERLKTQGIDLATSDINSPQESKIVIYNEMPRLLPRVQTNQRLYLLLFESALIRPDNWNLEKHKLFSKVFTWDDSFVDGDKYIKINFSANLPVAIPKDLTKKTKLCALIAGNKKVKHPLELYSKRIEAIRWFESTHPKDFDLYGVGWDRFRFTGPKIIRALNKVEVLAKLFAPVFPSYKGMVDEKKLILEKYKFSICYENAKDIPGYITEKIFDCFVAGCIPIYWGANNISDHVPERCFIDKRNFHDYEALYQYLTTMSDVEYMKRLDAIESFLHSEKGKLFSGESFAEVIINTMVTEMSV